MRQLLSEALGRPAARRERRHREALLALLRGAPLASFGDELPALVSQAEAEGLSGLLAERHPPFTRSAQAFTMVSLRALRFTRRAVAALEEANLPCAVLKGVAVAHDAWASASQRPQSDVDLLVARDDLEQAGEALIRAGLARGWHLRGEHYHHATLYPAPGAPAVELHHSLSDNLHLTVDPADLLRRRRDVPTDAGRLPALSLEDTVVHLALHAANHSFERLSWLWDLDGYARRQPVDWALAAERANAWHAALAVEAAWTYAVDLLESPIPATAIRALHAAKLRRTLSRALLRASHSTHQVTRLTFARAYRLSLVPAGVLLPTLATKFRARAEERRAYSAPADGSPLEGVKP